MPTQPDLDEISQSYVTHKVPHKSHKVPHKVDQSHKLAYKSHKIGRNSHKNSLTNLVSQNWHKSHTHSLTNLTKSVTNLTEISHQIGHKSHTNSLTKSLIKFPFTKIDSKIDISFCVLFKFKFQVQRFHLCIYAPQPTA